SVENPAQYCASELRSPSVSPGPPTPRSARESYHETARLPEVGSSEIFGRNWLLRPVSWFTRTASLHVAPPVSEWRTNTLVSSLSFLFSLVYTRYTRPAWAPPVRSQARPGSESTERPDCGGM